MSQTATQARIAPRFTFESVITLIFWPAMCVSSIGFIAPAPFDLFVLALIPVWLLSKWHLNPVLITFFVLTLLRYFLEVFALFPYVNEADAFQYVYYSTIIFVFSGFFALFFSDNAQKRIDIFIKGYFISCIIASIIGIIGYLDIGGTASIIAPEGGRTQGTFEDPNVMGSFCVLGALYPLQALLLGKTRHVLFMALSCLVIVTAILLTFSRGSWGAMVVTTMMMAILAFCTAEKAATRRRVAAAFFGIVVIFAVIMTILLLNDNFREVFFQRASVVQEYDVGTGGRFGNQIKALPMLLDLPWGFGPLRFRLVFGLEPHNSYIGAFANSGWLAGFTFIGLMLVTNFVGLRLCLVRSPYRTVAQIVWPALFAHFMQGFQIDIDHWRFFAVVLGAVWGLEAARMAWLQRQIPRPLAPRMPLVLKNAEAKAKQSPA